MKIAILDDYQDAVRKLDCFQLLADHEVKVFNNTVRGLGQLASRLAEVDALVLIRERTRITSQLLDKLPHLRMISQTGKAGPHIDIAACTERGIRVARGESGSPEAPAELAVALMLSARRHVVTEAERMRRGEWPSTLSHRLRGSMLGIFGLGHIGRYVAAAGHGLGMHVLV